MSEIGLNINVDSYNNEGIKTIKGNNNAEIYKLYILKNKRRLSLIGKTVKLGYVMAGTTKGDIIENLNITNAEQGEITFPITNRISKKDGVYSCQLAIYGADEFLEYTATFGLTVEANIFTKIAGEIENSKDLTYIERILEEAKTVSGDLKTNIPVATNLNSSLESNISNARNINTTLADTTEKSKVAATDAIEKKSQLEKSITKAKEFIDGLDGSQDIPQLRLDVTELQNGLKSNQALSYEGSSISANDTLEGRTEGMKIGGRTLVNLVKYRLNNQKVGNPSLSATLCTNEMFKTNTTYTIIYTINSIESGNGKTTLNFSGGMSAPDIILNSSNLVGTHKQTFTLSTMPSVTHRNVSLYHLDRGTVKLFSDVLIIEGEVDFVPNYFKGLKSFGEAEQEVDKYKITILSHGKNLCDFQKSKLHGSLNAYITEKNGEFSYSVGVDDKVGWFAETDNIKINEGNYTISIEVKANLSSGAQKFWYGVYLYDVNGTYLGYRGTYVNTTNNYNRYNLSVDIPPNTSFCKFRVYNYSNIAGTITFKNPQLEEGTVATPYEPYKCDKKDILLKEPLKECDYVYEDNGQVKVYRDARKYVITGNEDWSQYTDNRDFTCMGFFLQLNKIFDAKLGGKFICNNFKGSDTDVFPGNITVDDEIIFVKGRSGEASPSYIKISISKSKLTTQNVEGFKKWLKANPTEIVYQLSTPTIEIVDNCVDIDLDTYQEKTYFNILNSLPGTLDFKVPSNIGSLVQSNAKEINNINEFINNFILKALLEMNKDLAAIKIKNGLN